MTSVPLLVQRTKNGIRVKIRWRMEGEKKRSLSFSFPSFPASFLFCLRLMLSTGTHGPSQRRRAGALYYTKGHEWLKADFVLTLKKIYNGFFIWKLLTLLWMNPSQVSLFEPRLVKGVIGVSLNTQQNKPLFDQFSFMQNSASLKMWAAYWGYVSQSVSQSVICIQLYCKNKCTSPQTTANDSIRPSK